MDSQTGENFLLLKCELSQALGRQKDSEQGCLNFLLKIHIFKLNPAS
jgi:hypothetical protein